MNLNNSITKDREDNKKKAIESLKLSPDTNNMILVVLDDKTRLFFKSGTSKEKIDKRVSLYKSKVYINQGIEDTLYIKERHKKKEAYE